MTKVELEEKVKEVEEENTKLKNKLNNKHQDFIKSQEKRKELNDALKELNDDLKEEKRNKSKEANESIAKLRQENSEYRKEIENYKKQSQEVESYIKSFEEMKENYVNSFRAMGYYVDGVESALKTIQGSIEMFSINENELRKYLPLSKNNKENE